jgi:hypothetical protein
MCYCEIKWPYKKDGTYFTCPVFALSIENSDLEGMLSAEDLQKMKNILFYKWH